MSSDDLRSTSSSSESSQPESTPPVSDESPSFSSVTPEVSTMKQENEPRNTQDSECCDTYFNRHPVQFVLVLLAVVVALVFFGFRMVHGDTVYLKNGRSFNGIVTEHIEVVPVDGDERLYRVFFGSADQNSEEYKGFIDVEKKNVESVEKNDLDDGDRM